MKKCIAIIPHLLYLIFFVAAIILAFDLKHGDYGMIVPVTVFLLAPLPSAISAVGLMIVNLKDKTEKRKGIPVAYGVIGCFAVFLYLLVLLGAVLEKSDGFFFAIYSATVYIAPACMLAIWVLWIIRAAISRKGKGGYKYIPKNERSQNG